MVSSVDIIQLYHFNNEGKVEHMHKYCEYGTDTCIHVCQRW